MYPYNIQGSNVSILVKGVLHQFGIEHLAYGKLVAAIKEDDELAVDSLITVCREMSTFRTGKVSISEGVVRWNAQIG